MSKPYTRRWWRGALLDNRTISALVWAEKQWSRKGRVGHGKTLHLTQGSYNAGGVSASAGTHDGGGAVDLSTHGLTTKQRKRLVRWLRRAGFAAWYRPPISGLWGPHIHAILAGHRTASAGAKAQVVAYRNHRNGLANNGYDATWRPKPLTRWSHRQRKPIPKPKW